MSFRTSSRSRAGFTLIELLVVIAIIATLAAVVAPNVFSHISDARRSAARSQVAILTLALDAYRLDLFAYPTTQQGLDALRIRPGLSANGGAASWRGPYLRATVPADPWGRAWVYRSPGIENPESFDLYTLGRDGRVGGSGEDSDITSWNGPVRQ